MGQPGSAWASSPSYSVQTWRTKGNIQHRKETKPRISFVSGGKQVIWILKAITRESPGGCFQNCRQSAHEETKSVTCPVHQLSPTSPCSDASHLCFKLMARARGDVEWGGSLVQTRLFLLLSGQMPENKGFPGAMFRLFLAHLCARLLICGMKVVEGGRKGTNGSLVFSPISRCTNRAHGRHLKQFYHG